MTKKPLKSEPNVRKSGWKIENYWFYRYSYQNKAIYSLKSIWYFETNPSVTSFYNIFISEITLWSTHVPHMGYTRYWNFIGLLDNVFLILWWKKIHHLLFVGFQIENSNRCLFFYDPQYPSIVLSASEIQFALKGEIVQSRCHRPVIAALWPWGRKIASSRPDRAT